MKTDKTTTTITETTIKLGGDELVNLLKDQIPENATEVTITFDVPGGGDWSNKKIDLMDTDMQECITISYKLQTTNEISTN